MIKPIFLAHRGSWHEKHIENTIDAFDETLKKLSPKLHGFECDFRQTDEEDPKSWVIFHDETMKRLSHDGNKIDPKIELKFNERTGTMPTLTYFTQWIRKITKTIIINIEIKTGTESGVRELVQQLNASNQKKNVTFIFSSFDKMIMRHLEEENVKKAYLIRQKKDIQQFELTQGSQAEFIGIAHKRANNEIYTEIQKLNLSTGIYFKSKTEYITHIHEVMNTQNVSVIFIEN